jgi:hypothetical protein
MLTQNEILSFFTSKGYSIISKIRRHGNKIFLPCPSHNEKNNDSFNVNLDTGLYYCFACGFKGKVKGGSNIDISYKTEYNPSTSDRVIYDIERYKETSNIRLEKHQYLINKKLNISKRTLELLRSNGCYIDDRNNLNIPFLNIDSYFIGDLKYHFKQKINIYGKKFTDKGMGWKDSFFITEIDFEKLKNKKIILVEGVSTLLTVNMLNIENVVVISCINYLNISSIFFKILDKGISVNNVYILTENNFPVSDDITESGMFDIKNTLDGYYTEENGSDINDLYCEGKIKWKQIKQKLEGDLNNV